MAVAIVFLALLGGIVGTTWGLVRATKAEADAVAESVEKEKALLHKDQALARVQEEQTRTKLALLESRREAVRLAFEQAYGECDRGDSDRGFLALGTWPAGAGRFVRGAPSLSTKAAPLSLIARP
jgi:hypothetical protein